MSQFRRTVETQSYALEHLGALTTDATGKLDVLGHDSDALGVDSAQVGVLEEGNQVRLGSLLKSKDSGTLESKVVLEVLGDLADKTLEGKLADQKVGGLLVAADLTKSDGSWAVTVGLLDTAGSGCRLAGGLGGQLLAGSFSTGGFACGLFGTSHY